MHRILFSAFYICLSAATYDDAMFKALTWRNIGPNRGGRSITCAGSQPPA